MQGMMGRARSGGATAAGGYFRQGLAELRAAAPYGDSAIAQSTDYGMPGMATPGEVGAARRDDASPSMENDSVLQGRLDAIGSEREDKGRDDRDQSMDRD